MPGSLAAKALMFSLAVASLLEFSLQSAFAQTTSQSPSASSSESTVFECISTDAPDRYATIARRGQLVSPPMITWQQVQYYSPQQRCAIVSGRLNTAVQASGGRFGNLLLTYGNVNNQSVICYVNSMSGTCNADNVLLTLAPQDRGRERQILRQLVTFGTDASGGPLVRSGARREYANLGARLEHFLGVDELNQSSQGDP